MNERTFAIFGVIGPLVAYIFIGVAIASAPWFSWWDNALSDLGHALRKDSAPYFNFGLVVAGLFVVLYSVTALRRHAKYTSTCLAASAFLLQLLAAFDEVYGSLHRTVSVLLFVSMGVALIVYAVEKRSFLAVIAFLAGFGSWILYWTGFYSSGIAVPEIVSAAAVTLWVGSVAARIHLGRL